MEYKGEFTHNLGFSGSIQPTKNWNFTFNTDFNFDLKKFTSVELPPLSKPPLLEHVSQLYPLGPYKSYNFVIRANASLLQDLKYPNATARLINNMDWY